MAKVNSAAEAAAALAALGAGSARPGPAAGDEVPDAPPDEVARAHDIALRRLTVRARSRSELESDLAARDVPAEAAAEVLDRLEAVGLVDDAEFARQWVEQRRGSKGLSAAKLKAELREKGVADDVIAAALDDAGGDDAELAFEFARRRLRSFAGLDRTAFMRRLAGQLANRGFPESVVRKVVFTLADEREAGA